MGISQYDPDITLTFGSLARQSRQHKAKGRHTVISPPPYHHVTLVITNDLLRKMTRQYALGMLSVSAMPRVSVL